MKTTSKKIIIISTVVLFITIFAIGLLAETVHTYHDGQLVESAYKIREIEKGIESKKERLLLPYIPFKISGDFAEGKFHPFVHKNSEGVYVGAAYKVGGIAWFEIFFDLPEPGSTGNSIKFSSLRDYDGNNHSGFHIRRNSAKIVKGIGESLKKSIECFNERQPHAQEYMDVSEKLGFKLNRIDELMENLIDPIKKSTSLKRGAHSFTIETSKTFGQIQCNTFFDPDPIFKLKQIELITLASKHRIFDVEYSFNNLSFEEGWSYLGNIKNEGTTLETFELLSNVADEIIRFLEKCQEDPNILIGLLLLHIHLNEIHE
jgi:hypothetical protein